MRLPSPPPRRIARRWAPRWPLAWALVALAWVVASRQRSALSQDPAVTILPLPPLEESRAGERTVDVDPEGSLLPLVEPSDDGSAGQFDGSSTRIPSSGVFLPSDNAWRFWEDTVATVSLGHVIARLTPPDFDAVPPRPGVIESVWTEPPGSNGAGGVASWPPKRQRVVVRVVPAGGGAWVEGMVETQALAGPPPIESEADKPLPLDVLSGIDRVARWEPLPPLPMSDGTDASRLFTSSLAVRMAPPSEVIATLPTIDEGWDRPTGVPWADTRHPRLARAGYKVLEDYRNFYSCESLTCLTAAFGAGALMANTGFDVTMQNAWQTGVTPTGLGTFFSGCKDIGEGRYALPIFGAAAVTGLLFEGSPTGDVFGEWGSRSLRVFVVGAPPLYVLQLATGSARPDESPVGSRWVAFHDNNGVSGHAFVGAIPFLAAAGMVEGPIAKGSLYVCSTFVAFSRITDNAHYPSQAFLGWYLAFASAMAVNKTELHFAGMEVRVVPIPVHGGGSGMGLETRW